MDLSEAVTGVLVGTSTALLFAFVRWAFPSARWTRRLKRDMEIVAGLPDGHEKEQWKARVVALARHLRAYEKFVPWWQRGAPVFFAAGGAFVAGTVVFVAPILLEESPVITATVIVVVLTSLLFVSFGIAGADLSLTVSRVRRLEQEEQERELEGES